MLCNTCPRQCGAIRTENTPSAGFCKMPYNAVIARAALHFWEEPPLSAHGGAGAIFFSGCTLRCIDCQNFEISHKNFGKCVSVDRFVEIMQELEAAGAQNIDLVNPTHFAPFLRDTLTKYKPHVPVVYNSGGYDSVETLKSLSGLVDIYLPDFKYMSEATARLYSAAPDYPERAKAAILEMRRQTKDRFAPDGRMLSGLIVRHLVLPQGTKDSSEILRWIAGALSKDTYVSLMRQYSPCGRTYPYKALNRRLTTAEYDRVLRTFFDLGLHNGFMQEGASANDRFIPAFDLTGV